MMKRYIVVSSHESKTLLLGAALAVVCSQGCIIYLHGCVGSGKSVFCKGFLYELGYIGYLNSPTYTFVESYILNNQHVCHFDFYRLISSEEIEYMGIRDYFDSYTICLIEWPEQVSGILPAEDISITMNYYDCQNSRKIVIESCSDLGYRVLNSLLAYRKLYT